MAQSAPGIIMNSSTGGGYGNFSAFGLPGTSNLFTVNGNDYNDAFLNLNNSGSSNLLLGGNELQEVAVVSNGYTGQYGRQAGAQIDYSTKSGSNAFHGDAVYNWTGRALTANDPLNKARLRRQPRPFENNNQWAASLGGPIKKDKAYFFVNTEGIRYIFGSIQNVSVPTPAFQSFVLGNVPRIRHAGVLCECFQALQQRARDRQRQHQMPTAARDSQLRQEPQVAPAPRALRESVSSGNKEWLLSGRVDYNLGKTTRLFGRVQIRSRSAADLHRPDQPGVQQYEHSASERRPVELHAHLFPDSGEQLHLLRHVLLGGFRQFESVVGAGSFFPATLNFWWMAH